MNLTFAKLRNLVTVADELSLTKAAKRLNLSQPALSRSILSIEQAYGFTLFERRSSGLVLTSIGKIVVADARNLLARIRSYHHTLELYGTGDKGRVAFGIAPQVASLLLPDIAKKFSENSSNVMIKSLIGPAEVVAAALRREEIDFGFIAGTIPIEESMICSNVGTLSSGLFVRSGHPILHNEVIELELLRNFTISCANKSENYEIIGKFDGIFLCDNFNILKIATLSSDIVCLCSKEFVQSEVERGDLVQLQVDDISLTDQPISLIKLDRRALSPLAFRIVSFVELFLG